MSSSREPASFGIGEVLGRLRAEFPDVSTSKIRFLEAEGLIEPGPVAIGVPAVRGGRRGAAPVHPDRPAGRVPAATGDQGAPGRDRRVRAAERPADAGIRAVRGRGGRRGVAARRGWRDGLPFSADACRTAGGGGHRRRQPGRTGRLRPDPQIRPGTTGGTRWRWPGPRRRWPGSGSAPGTCGASRPPPTGTSRWSSSSSPRSCGSAVPGPAPQPPGTPGRSRR